MDSNTMVNIGIQRFDRLREQGKFYIDKTGFVFGRAKARAFRILG